MGAVHEGFVALTPLHLDLTNHRAVTHLAEWSGSLTAQLRADPAPPRPVRARRRGARPK